jgi:hypothetical protein
MNLILKISLVQTKAIFSTPPFRQCGETPE